ncbi:MAG: HAD hydrolase family protein [Alphaproteobacteria bacterium]|jgi:3-deoxy-D-manno-octulosonate 8-phosphate phosphatase (KDO 8-P phosphatase)|nr:HAD hydrolase family protein [Alphaproteobacteria bacterium]
MFISKEKLMEKLKTVELLCVDMDGTLTDGGMYLDENNVATKKFFAHDGTGLSMVKKLGVKIALITTSQSPIAKFRGEVLGFTAVVDSSHRKGDDILALCEKLNVNPQNTIHMGDDVNDILGFKVVGLPIAVANSVDAILEHAIYKTYKAGGSGAVREICDLILLAKTGKLYGAPYVVDEDFTQ